ncbi:MAG: papain-like cysteine protease family protein [Bacteroidota bacterium]
MSIILNISPLRQPTQMSCWWTCMRMVYIYAGENDPYFPENRDPAFRPVGGSVGRLHHLEFPDASEIDTSNDTATAITMRRWSQRVVLHPSEWYQRGVPMTPRGLERMQELTGFAPVPNQPAFGQWTTEHIEDYIRTNGPFMFIGNWNGQGFHAVLVIGREEQAEVDEIVYIDPAMGMRINVNIEYFNEMMSSIGMQRGNPVYYPPAARRRRTTLNRR